jgi:hypothetical protein
MRKHHIKSWILLKSGTKKENAGVVMSPMKHSLKFSGWRPDNLLDWCAMQRWKLAFVWFACILARFVEMDVRTETGMELTNRVCSLHCL